MSKSFWMNASNFVGEATKGSNWQLSKIIREAPFWNAFFSNRHWIALIVFTPTPCSCTMRQFLGPYYFLSDGRNDIRNESVRFSAYVPVWRDRFSKILHTSAVCTGFGSNAYLLFAARLLPLGLQDCTIHFSILPSYCYFKQDKVNTADSAFISLIILLISHINSQVGQGGKDGLVWSLLER